MKELSIETIQQLIEKQINEKIERELNEFINSINNTLQEIASSSRRNENKTRG